MNEWLPILSWLIFLLGSIALVWFSRQPLRHPRSHGFYRFFAWEILLILFVVNMTDWFTDPLAWYQLISWVLLILSIVLVVLGMKLLRDIGRQNAGRSDPALLGLEKTAKLVTIGLYRYIRHPLYSSLLFLGWGMFFKSPSWPDAGLALLCTLFLFATARVEEQENIDYFGEEYAAYMRRSKMFVPFIF
jgi:protein-S-isoprenylcysteine O-methyltransferase Ste14